MRGRGGKLGAAIALAVAALAGGCGDGDGLAGMAPADAPLYLEFALDADGEAAGSVAALGERLAGVGDPRARLVARLDRALSRAPGGLSFAADIEPWLGGRGALFVRSFEPAGMSAPLPDLAVALEVEDLEAARASIDRVAEAAPSEAGDHGGYDYRLFAGGIAAGLVEETLLIGTEASFQVAVDAAEGESLADSDEYRARLGLLPSESLGFAYLEPAAAIEAALMAAGEDRRATMLGPLLAGPLSAPAAVAVTAGEDSASLELATAISGAEEPPAESPLLAQLPAESWLALAAPDLGQTIERTLDRVDNSGVPGDGSIEQAVRDRTGLDPRADLLAWLSDTAAFVEGGTGSAGLVGGLVAETDDPQGPRRLLAVARRLARSSGHRTAGPPAGSDYGFTVAGANRSREVEAGVYGYRVAAVAGGAAAGALEPERTLGDERTYQEAIAALGDEFVPGLYLEPSSLLALTDEQGASTGVAARLLARLESVVGGSTVAGGLEHSRVTLTPLP